jgi:dihydrofolate reductase
MGRKTYQSLGKALPKRENGVITRDVNFKLPDARIFHSLEEAISYYKDQKELADKTLFVIGGAEIYTLSLPLLDEVWLTEIDAEFPGDAFFPKYREGRFEVSYFKRGEDVKKREDSSSPYSYFFRRYVKI